MKLSNYEEKLKFVNEFIKINSPSSMFGYKFSNENILPKYRDESKDLFSQVWDWLWLNGITISKNKGIYNTFEHDKELCEKFLQHCLTIEYFKS